MPTCLFDPILLQEVSKKIYLKLDLKPSSLSCEPVDVPVIEVHESSSMNEDHETIHHSYFDEEALIEPSINSLRVGQRA